MLDDIPITDILFKPRNIKSKEDVTNLLIDEKMFGSINQGAMTVSINGKPILSLDRDAKSLGFEMSGLEESNLRISNLFKSKSSKGKIFLESSNLVKRLVKNGWKLSLYERGREILTTNGPSRLGPRLHFNPLKLRQILKVI